MSFRGGPPGLIGAYGSYGYKDRWRWPYPDFNARFGLYGNAGSYGSGQSPLGGGFNATLPVPGYRPTPVHSPPHYGYTVGYVGGQGPRGARRSIRHGAHGARGFYGPEGGADLHSFRGQGTHAFYPRGAGIYYPASWRPAFW